MVPRCPVGRPARAAGNPRLIRSLPHARPSRCELAAAVALLAACADAPTRPEPAQPLILDARINVQLGDTPVGSHPLYIVTGRVTATQGGAVRTARVDSIVVDYARNAGAWVRLRRTTQLPFSDELPFAVAAGDVYRLNARLYASAVDAAGVRQTQVAEWLASGAALAP